MAKKKEAQKEVVQEEMIVEHSPKFADVKNYYDAGLWKKKAVRNAVIRGWITAAEYEEITGEIYE